MKKTYETNYLNSNVERGLTQDEVKKRIAHGEVNQVEQFTTRTIPGILQNNIVTVFNGVLFASVIALLIIHTFIDALFLFAVTLFNICLGIIEELRAKWALDRLQLLQNRTARVIRDGEQQEIPLDKVVKDDLILFKAGDPIIADGNLISLSFVSIDESLLTGEQEAVHKRPGDKLLSGSFCISGLGYYRASLIGENSHVNQLTAQAKSYKIERTPLQKGINKIIEAFTAFLIYFVILLVLASHVKQISIEHTILAIVTIIKSLVPEGLVLVMTLSFALGAYRIARQHVLIQKINSIEAMGHLTTLCLDKTGTIGTNLLHYHSLIPLNISEEKVIQKLKLFLGGLSEKNRTIEAIETQFPSIKVEIIDELPFSSENKISATHIRHGQEELSLWLGAPEAMAKEQITEDLKTLLTQYRDQGLRVLLFASTLEALPQRTNLTLCALIILQDELRADIKEAINFYESRQVNLKILSGDHPNTVLAIAKQAGFTISGKVVNGRELDNLNEHDFITAILEGQIFGNLLPKDKVRIIETLQRHGEYVGMIGDGVNDVLALKQADIGIAMHSGAAAARDVADVTLLQDSFTHLPNLSKEGDHIIYNIKRIAKLFITKNIYILFFVLFVGFIGLEFPLTPRTITWIDVLTIGIPTVLLTLMTPTLKPQTAKNFVLETLQFALLTGVIIAMASLFVYAYFYLVQERTYLYGKTASISVIVLMNLYVVNYLAMPERKQTPHLQFWFITIILLCAFILHFIVLYWPLARYLIGLTSLEVDSWIVIFGASLVGLLILKILSKRFGITLGG